MLYAIYIYLSIYQEQNIFFLLMCEKEESAISVRWIAW